MGYDHAATHCLQSGSNGSRLSNAMTAPSPNPFGEAVAQDEINAIHLADYAFRGKSMYKRQVIRHALVAGLCDR